MNPKVKIILAHFCVLSVFAASVCLILTWSGIWTFQELGQAVGSYRKLPFSGLVVCSVFAALSALAICRFRQEDPVPPKS